jgi:O-antigen ligase
VLLGLALAVFFLDQYFGKRLAYIKVDKVVFLLGLYLTVAVLSVIYVVDLRYFVFGLKAIAFGLTAYLLVYNLINTHKRIYYLLCAVTATAALLSLQLFWKFYSMGWSSQFIFERNMIFIPIGPIATASAILALLAPLVLGFYFYLPKEKKARPFLLAAFVMAFLGVFLTLGKAALGSLAVALFYLLIKNRRAETPYILVFLWFTFLAYLFFYPFVAGLFERLAKTLVDVNTQFRVTEYETGWEIIRNHPWVGVGAGQQLHYFGRFLNLDNPQLVNNYFLQPLINLGVIGLALALFIFHRLYKNTRELISGAGQYYLLAAGFAASMLAAALNGLAEVTIFALPYAIIFWSIAGVMPNIGKENI